MFKELHLGAYFKISFRGYNRQLAMVEIIREGKAKTTLMLTLEDIYEFREHLEWLEGKLLQMEKLEEDEILEFREEYGDEEC